MTPIYKDSYKERLLNDMPMSILPWFSKILARIIYKRLHYLVFNKGILLIMLPSKLRIKYIICLIKTFIQLTFL